MRLVVGAVAEGGGAEIGVALGHGVDVEQHLLRAAAAGLAGVDGVLGAGGVAAEVFPRAVRHGDGGVVFLQAAAHLSHDCCLQGFDGGEHGFGVGVLGEQVVADVGAQDGRVAEHALPVGVLHPGVFVDADAAELVRSGGGSWGRWVGCSWGGTIARRAAGP